MPKKPPQRPKTLALILTFIRNLKGWRYYGFSAFLGMLAVGALPPFHLIPVLMVSFPLWIMLVERAEDDKTAFKAGWAFGFGHFVAGLYWISNSLLVDAARFAWLIPFAVSLIPAGLAIYTGIVAVIIRRLQGSYNIWRVTSIAALWVMVEYLRAYLFTGFPWNLIGYSWTFSDAMIQFAAVGGIWALSFLAVWVAASPILLLEKRKTSFVSVMLITITIAACGYVRLAYAPEEATQTTVQVVQANIKQEMKWDEKYRLDTLMQHVRASSHDGKKPAADFIVWPETAVPFVLEKEPFIKDIFRKNLKREETVITGALRLQELPQYRIWNSLYAVSGAGNVQGNYDKVRLVPFGEYVPFRAVLPFIEKITHGSVDFSHGDKPKTIQVKKKPPFAPLICYEVIYPDDIVDEDQRPEWIVNVTNDAWFGASTGPYQHFAMSRVRAVEQGLPLVRAANTGISGIIDAYGRVEGRSPLNHAGVISGNLPKPAATTPFAQMGSIPILLCITLLFCFATIVKGRHSLLLARRD